MDFKTYIKDMVVASKPCKISFRSSNGAVVYINAIITDFYSDEGESYLATDKGFRISLQDLRYINDCSAGPSSTLLC